MERPSIFIVRMLGPSIVLKTIRIPGRTQKQRRILKNKTRETRQIVQVKKKKLWMSHLKARSKISPKTHPVSIQRSL